MICKGEFVITVNILKFVVFEESEGLYNYNCDKIAKTNKRGYKCNVTEILEKNLYPIQGLQMKFEGGV